MRAKGLNSGHKETTNICSNLHHILLDNPTGQYVTIICGYGASVIGMREMSREAYMHGRCQFGRLIPSIPLIDHKEQKKKKLL